MLRAELALGAGSIDRAIDLLRAAAATANVFETHESLARALEASGDLTGALEEWRWVAGHRGQAWAEWHERGFGRQLRLVDWNRADYHRGRLHELLDEPEAAAERYRAFLDRFSDPGADDPLLETARRRLGTLPGGPV
jgi:tetratricopeptide (TPR) repeat protein